MARQRQTRNANDKNGTAHTGDAASSAVERGTSGEPTEAQIAECAYFIWLAKGSPPGHDEACWHEAEHQLRSDRAID